MTTTTGVDGAVAHPATIRRVLVEADPAGLQEANTASSVGQLPARDRPPVGTPDRELRPMIAVDGKTVRGATDDDGRQPHLVAALDQHTGAVLAQTVVARSPARSPSCRWCSTGSTSPTR